MRKFLSLCSQVVSVQSTCREPLPRGGEKHDIRAEANMMLSKAHLSHDEILYGRAVVGDAFYFEAKLQKMARIEIALSFNLSNEKVTRYSAGIAELVILYIRGKTRKMTAKEMAIICGCKEWNWHNRYKAVYDLLRDWCNELESSADGKVGKVVKAEQEN